MTQATFTGAYIEAALWSSTDDDGDPLDDGRELSKETADKMAEDCRAFYLSNGPFDDDEQAGHDFWLTRNGHGAGFWDGDWPEPDATRLTNASQCYGEFSLYVGDDGFVYGV